MVRFEEEDAEDAPAELEDGLKHIDELKKFNLGDIEKPSTNFLVTFTTLEKEGIMSQLLHDLKMYLHVLHGNARIRSKGLYTTCRKKGARTAQTSQRRYST
ncbi:UNVERIFIED_CONTAM: hypothetical protein Sangu_2259800 [Sesamum angustifolium]|uniref:Uncharacterized protein n=1 Tax=Sesamum angustifolium TaxID=2727405 RepID=A0AAW2L6B2_9LAMI